MATIVGQALRCTNFSKEGLSQNGDPAHTEEAVAVECTSKDTIPTQMPIDPMPAESVTPKRIDTSDPVALRCFLTAQGFEHTTETWFEKMFPWKPQPWNQTAKMIHDDCAYRHDHSQEAILRFANEIVGYNLLMKCGSPNFKEAPSSKNTEAHPVTISFDTEQPTYCHTVDSKAQFSSFRPLHLVQTPNSLDVHASAPK